MRSLLSISGLERLFFYLHYNGTGNGWYYPQNCHEKIYHIIADRTDRRVIVLRGRHRRREEPQGRLQGRLRPSHRPQGRRRHGHQPQDHRGQEARSQGPRCGGPPYSPTQTCAACHPTVFISHGWHFNAMEKAAKPGRNGEPWIYVDAATHTVLPVSYRDWAGAFKPAQAGLTDWDMAQTFGRHMPGGSFGTPPQSEARTPATTQPTTKPSPLAERWQYTGRIEVDCLICHSSQNRHDATERGIEIMRMQNFRWAPTVAMEFGRVNYSAASLGKTGEDEEDDAKPPRLTYNAEVFDTRARSTSTSSAARPIIVAISVTPVSRRPTAKRRTCCRAGRTMATSTSSRG